MVYGDAGTAPPIRLHGFNRTTFSPCCLGLGPIYYIIVCSCTTSRPLYVIDLHVHASPMHAAKLGAVVRLFQLLVILPATNATSERSFSALRRIKSYLRCTMSQARLNHLMILHYHQEMTSACISAYTSLCIA